MGLLCTRDSSLLHIIITAILIQNNVHMLSLYIFPGAVVGLEPTFFNVSEDVGVVQLCAIVISPVITCPIDYPFDVRLSTDDGTAG